MCFFPCVFFQFCVPRVHVFALCLNAVLLLEFPRLPCQTLVGFLLVELFCLNKLLHTNMPVCVCFRVKLQGRGRNTFLFFNTLDRARLAIPIYRGSRLNASKFMDDVHGELLPQFVHTYHSNWSDQKKTVLRNLE